MSQHIATQQVEKKTERSARREQLAHKLYRQYEEGRYNELMWNTVNQTGFCALIRHGERADNIDGQMRDKLGIEVEDLNDPPLTPLGIDQAKDTANYLKQYLEKNEYTHVVIEASPFLRTMQTAATVAKVLDVPKIRLNCLLAKWMRVKNRTAEESMGEFNPFNHLIVSKIEANDEDECNLDHPTSCKS